MTESRVASSPELIRESEFTFSPVLFTKRPRSTLTRTPAATMTRAGTVYSGVSGWRIFLADSVKEVIPAYRTIREITMALRYSIRPYPKGCFLSGCFPASFVPTMVITEEAASEKLFTASSTIAMEWVSSPTTALKAARRTLARIPITLVRMMIRSRPDAPSALLSLYSSSSNVSFISIRPIVHTPFCLRFPAHSLSAAPIPPHCGRAVPFRPGGIDPGCTGA